MPTLPRSLPLIGALLLTTPAAATMFNADRVEPSGHWHSLRLSLGEAQRFRATNTLDQPGTAFSVDFAPPHCRPLAELRVEMHEFVATPEIRQSAADLRIDDQASFAAPAELRREPGDSGAYALFNLDEPYRLLHELRSGETLRLRLGDDDAPWELDFALDGAGPALDRAARLCRRATDEEA
ncbi:hypothetical protein PRZ61_13970 [Halomonas pacifica]|uniref:hypothetical protein n=1 Tax=Bisbaumannia pacifica TaxID=77098 RepID=UPI002359DF52|nr:hypothetical protein [Halomonas pacifica]MDC8804556.1 hypothetical protein [Halomonas pacifica]